ncbi:MAG: hypothetical protein ACXWTR_05380 [Methylotenera sp.]
MIYKFTQEEMNLLVLGLQQDKVKIGRVIEAIKAAVSLQPQCNDGAIHISNRAYNKIVDAVNDL